MKRNIKNILGVCGVMFLTWSAPGCNDALELSPLDAVSDATFYKDASQFKLATNSFYGYLRSFNVGNGDGHLGSDLYADRGAFARGTNTAVSVDNNYNDAYAWIRNINYFLVKAAGYPKQEEIKTYVAEAHFFRGYVYFDKLLQNYGGVILVKDVLTPQSAELSAAKSSREEVVDFIIQELEAAIPDLPLEGNIGAGDKGRVSKQAAQAFLARVCLYEGTWQKFRNGNAGRFNSLFDKSITNSNAVITAAQHSLFKPAVLGDSALKYMFILENQKSNPANVTKSANQEYILAVRYESANLLKTIPNNIGRGFGSNMSRKMADSYLMSDGLPIEKSSIPLSRATLSSEYANRDNRMRYFMAVPGRYHWQGNANWHINWNWSAVDIANSRGKHDPMGANSISGYGSQLFVAERQVIDSQEGFDYPTIRLAEVYLNYAEALYERNGVITDADLDKSLNLVRNRVNTTMPKLSNALVTTHGLDMREEIRRERAIELQGENFRMDDLKRWHIAHIELTKPVLGVKWTGTEYQTKYTTAPPLLNGDVLADPVSERKFSEKNYLMPFPTSQLQLNPNLKPNPDWQ